MPSVKLSPVLNENQFSNNNTLLSGGKIYWYIAGTTTPVSIYTESSGSVPQTNPIILNVRGEVTNPIWLPTGGAYKAVLTDSLDNIIKTYNNVIGINDTSAPVISEWVLYGGSATFINATSFSVTGDARNTFTVQRRIRATVSGGDCYATIVSSTFGAGITTVTVVNDSVILDSGLNSIYYGFLDPSHPSFDSTGINTATKSAFQNQSFTYFTTGGVTGAFTLTPTPALTSYVEGQRFTVKFTAIGNGTDTINVSGLGAIAIKKYDNAGFKINPVIGLNDTLELQYDGTHFLILNPLHSLLTSSTINSVVSTGSIPSSYVGSTVFIDSAADITITLPAANTISAGNIIPLYANNVGNIILLCAGADTMNAQGKSGITSIIIRQGESVTLVTNGSNTWVQQADSSHPNSRIIAWANFNGALAGTITPRANYNIFSVTKNGTGDYTLNFSHLLTDTRYVPVGNAQNISGLYSAVTVTINSSAASGITPPTTSSCRISVYVSGIGNVDSGYVCIAIMGTA